MQFKSVQARVFLDFGMFTFGVLDDTEESFACRLHALKGNLFGYGKHCFLTTKEAKRLLSQLQSISPEKSKMKVSVKVSRFCSIHFVFKGFDREKGYKIKSYELKILSLYLSSSPFWFNTYVSKHNLEVLISNLKKCV